MRLNKNIQSGKSLTSGLPAHRALHWQTIGVSIFLAVIIFAIYGQTLRYGFVNYDDEKYVYENPVVSAGLTLKGMAWAFGSYHLANWVPLTLISHMLDCQLYQLAPGGHHLTNILLHTASAIILFLVLGRMTGTLWPGAFVAAIFAIHPLHVESVAWVSERKDVLSGLFFMLTLWMYCRYANKPSFPGYLAVILFFALGLMSKPMLVTLPLILLLLDYWPLNRFAKTQAPVAGSSHLSWWKNAYTPSGLIVEKIPLLIMSIACCVVTLFAQTSAIQPLEYFPFSGRVGNALDSCVIYAYQTFCPANLAVFYPYSPKNFQSPEVIAAFIALTAVSLLCFAYRRSRPWLLVGWLWYLIMLAPVIGLVQVGNQARADRYMYLPQIGLCLMLTWLLLDLITRFRNLKTVIVAGAILALVGFSIDAFIQTTYWRDGETLWTHALDCTRDNATAHNNLGFALAQKGRMDDAVRHFQKAVEINPDYTEAYNNLGDVYFFDRQVDEALACYQKAAQLTPDDAVIQNNLGLALVQKGRLDEAIDHFQKAVGLDPDNADARHDLSVALAQKAQAGAH